MFEDWNLSLEVANWFTDPDGDYDYSKLVQFAQLVTFDDLRATGLKVACAHLLIANLQPASGPTQAPRLCRITFFAKSRDTSRLVHKSTNQMENACFLAEM